MDFLGGGPYACPGSQMRTQTDLRESIVIIITSSRGSALRGKRPPGVVPWRENSAGSGMELQNPQWPQIPRDLPPIPKKALDLGFQRQGGPPFPVAGCLPLWVHLYAGGWACSYGGGGDLEAG